MDFNRLRTILLSFLAAVILTCPVWLHSQSFGSAYTVFTSALNGLVPASGGGTTNFLRADGTFAVPPGSGGGVSSLNTLTGALTLAAGTNITLTPSGSTITIAAAGGSSGLVFPLTIVQENSSWISSNSSSFTVTFNSATASSGNTVFLACGSDGSATVGTPAGWTVDINQTETMFARFLLLHKATASDTSAAFTLSSSTMGCYYFEVTGSHTLDQVSKGGVAGPSLTFPALTPTSGAAVFAMAGGVCGGTCLTSASINPAWQWVYAGAFNTSSARFVFGNIYRGTSAGGSITPPGINNNGGLFGGGGIAYAVFSIL